MFRARLELRQLREGQELREAAGVHGHEGDGRALRELVHAGLQGEGEVLGTKPTMQPAREWLSTYHQDCLGSCETEMTT